MSMGGGDDKPGGPTPDYSKYIETMTRAGEGLQGYGGRILKWAEDSGLKLEGISDIVTGRAGKLADESAGQYSDSMAKWKKTYEPLYDAQAADAQRMIGELPKTEEQYAGKYGAGTAQAFDASREAQERSLRSYGLKAPGSGSQRLDAMVSNQRALGQVAAAEQGRMAARNEARDVTGKALQAGTAFADVGNRAGSMSLASGNQQSGALQSAISTTGAAYQPGLMAFNSAYPYMRSWGDTMSNQFNQNLAQANAAQSGGGSGAGAMVGGIAGTLAGSMMGGIGAPVGGAIGSKLGSMIGEKGGMIPEDGQVDNMVEPEMSGSQGAITDDVPARLNVGEFVIPKDVVAWLGEEKLQKLITSAREKREQDTVAEPEMAPASAIDEMPPTFQSEEPPL